MESLSEMKETSIISVVNVLSNYDVISISDITNALMIETAILNMMIDLSIPRSNQCSIEILELKSKVDYLHSRVENFIENSKDVTLNCAY